MANVDQQQLIKRISLGDVVRAVILMNPGSKYFKEEVLDFAFRKFSKENQKFRELFRTTCDGSSPEHSTALEDTIGFMELARILEYTGDWQHMYMTNFGRRVTEQHLRKDYGNGVFEVLKPIVEEVWEYVLEYGQQRC